MLVYVGISLGVGLIGGLILGGITACASQLEFNIFADNELFDNGHGLKKEPKVKKRRLSKF